MNPLRYNGVTLDIVDGIMKACEDYFVSFAPTVLRIIQWYSTAMLSSEMVRRIHKLVQYIVMNDHRAHRGASFQSSAEWPRAFSHPYVTENFSLF